MVLKAEQKIKTNIKSNLDKTTTTCYIKSVANSMQKRKVVIENEEGTAKSEYIKWFLDALLEVLKNDPPLLVAVCVTTLILVMVMCMIFSISSVFKYFFLMLQNFLKYIHNIILVVIYMRHKGKRIDDDALKRINENIDERVINIFDLKEERKEQKDTPASRSDSAFKKRSQRHDKN